jgi:glycosyltransferase involved in cell wall biosynthesis
VKTEVVALIPALNEAGTIAQVVRGVTRHVRGVVVVDDGSSDRTGALAA